MVRTIISSKGQTTIPNVIRSAWNTRAVVWERRDDGSAVVRPAPGVLSLFGAARDARRHDPREKFRARAAWGR